MSSATDGRRLRADKSRELEAERARKEKPIEPAPVAEPKEVSEDDGDPE